MNDAGVIAVSDDAAVWNVLLEEFFGPQDAVLGPGGFLVSAKAMDEDDARQLLEPVSSLTSQLTLLRKFLRFRPLHLDTKL